MNVSVSNLKFLCLIVGLISYTSPAYAYLDPGTGSILLQGLIAGVAMTMAFLSVYWQKTKAFFIKQEQKVKAFFLKKEPDTDIENKD